ncbi:hypothetical protein [Sphaerochaeta sp. S2]|uniref:hypothetical protein n=1 Tax=Sphaerochaeta sp. S2 TaxID=2798868 RepID=UPI0018E9DA6E|nr:hypothetical protein [Sphaerochaeta sp. S2]MBJ2356220.1 hypothetical protein [Sphaerochaeta sp. S2]
MKKSIIYLLLALVLILGAGCNLFPYFGKTVYFYEMAGRGNNDSTFRLMHQSGGHTIVMSRGKENVELSHDEAEALISQTIFILELDGEALDRVTGSKSVDELGNSGWHVVETFILPELRKGTFTLYGETKFYDMQHEGQPVPYRHNEVTLKIL